MWEPRAEEPWAFPGSTRKRGRGQAEEAGQAGGRRRRRQRAGEGSRRAERDESEGSRQAAGSEGEGEGEGENTSRYARLWQPEVWDTDRVSKAIGKVTVQHIGERLGVSL